MAAVRGPRGTVAGRVVSTVGVCSAGSPGCEWSRVLACTRSHSGTVWVEHPARDSGGSVTARGESLRPRPGGALSPGCRWRLPPVSADLDAGMPPSPSSWDVLFGEVPTVSSAGQDSNREAQTPAQAASEDFTEDRGVCGHRVEVTMGRRE